MHIIHFNIGDFSQATERFRVIHRGIFLNLLMAYYKSEKPLPDDTVELEWIAGVESKAERDALSLVLRRCFVHDLSKNVWRQNRADREIEAYRANGRQKRHANLCKYWEKANPGLPVPSLETFTADPSRYYDDVTRRVRHLSADAPHGLRTDELRISENGKTDSYTVNSKQEPVNSKQSTTPVVPKGTVSASSIDSDSSAPEQSPPSVPTGHSDPAKKRRGARGKPQWTDETKAIYMAYPRKVAPDAALRAIQRRFAEGIAAETLLQAVTAYAAATAGTEREFIPHPASWFNAGRFQDDPSEWTRQSAPSGPSAKSRGFTPPQIGEAELLRDTPPLGDGAPDGWLQAWSALTTAPAPEDWSRVTAAMQLRVIDWLDEKNREGGASCE